MSVEEIERFVQRQAYLIHLDLRREIRHNWEIEILFNKIKKWVFHDIKLPNNFPGEIRNTVDDFKNELKDKVQRPFTVEDFEPVFRVETRDSNNSNLPPVEVEEELIENLPPEPPLNSESAINVLSNNNSLSLITVEALEGGMRRPNKKRKTKKRKINRKRKTRSRK
jgi:hypothetical protein